MINRCRMHLQAVSIYDLLTHKGEIHPDYRNGYRPLSRHSVLVWPDHPSPPKRYWKLWQTFLQLHVTPYINKIDIQWDNKASPRYNISCYKSTNTPYLYNFQPDSMAKFIPITQQRHRTQQAYRIVPYICDEPFDPNKDIPVDVYFSNQGLTTIPRGKWSHTLLINLSPNPNPPSLHLAFSELDPSLQQIYGHVYFPPDDGISLCRTIVQQETLFGSADASKTNRGGTHAWIITSGLHSDITDPLLHISGQGPIDGLSPRHLFHKR